MTPEERAERAVEYKSNGNNCAQAVILALADETGLPEETLRSMAAGFGGGMGTMEGACGALVAAGMAAGLKTVGKGTGAYSRAIIRDFKDRCGAVVCKDLKGIETGNMLCSCDDCVRNAVRAYCAAFEA